MRYTVAFRTDMGKRHRVNQDAGGAWTWNRPDGTPAALIVAADGVSAGRHSEGASQLTVEILHDRLAPLLEAQDATEDAVLHVMLAAAREANHLVAERPHQALAAADATTLVAAFCVGQSGAGVWCGDSRSYLIEGLQAVPLTRDHSWAEGVVRHGIMSAEQAARDPRARMITRWLGPPDADDPGLETFRFRLEPGQSVLCCTDGLYMYFSPPIASESEIAQVVAETDRGLQAAVDELVDLAMERGGHDDITVAALRAEPEEAEGAPDGAMQVDDVTRLPFGIKRGRW